MRQRVSAIFPSREAAERAANALVDLGADRDQISMLARGEEGKVATAPAGVRAEDREIVEPARQVGDAGAPLTTTDEEEAAQGAATGAAIGAVAGIAAGLLALTVPGFGIIMAAGPLAWALGGAAGTAVAGAIAGGVYGGLRDLGIEETYARSYEERIREGDVLLTALIPRAARDQVTAVLQEHDAQSVSFTEAVPGVEDTGMADETASSYIAAGRAKQAEGAMRDRAADRTASPMDDLAAKAKKAEGELEEEYGEAEEVVTPRRA